MAFNDGLKDKILKLGAKQKLGAILKYANNPSEDVRMAVAMALGMIPTYDSGMALIPLLRDQSAMVRASACEAAAQIHASSFVFSSSFINPVAPEPFFALLSKALPSFPQIALEYAKSLTPLPLPLKTNSGVSITVSSDLMSDTSCFYLFLHPFLGLQTW